MPDITINYALFNINEAYTNHFCIEIGMNVGADECRAIEFNEQQIPNNIRVQRTRAYPQIQTHLRQHSR